MVLENYCRNCGRRIHTNEPYCPNCGFKTIYENNNSDYFFEIPIHNIGFFNLDIDFSPYINPLRKDYTYEICSCGFINNRSNEYCYMCGKKRNHSTFSKIIKNKRKPQFSIGNVLCECGHINTKDDFFCENCGKQIRENNTIFNDDYSNFNLEYDDSVFCFCGEENDKLSKFCRNCGRPLKSYGRMDSIYKLCSCSCINEVTSDFCTECGCELAYENESLICVCGFKNDVGSNFCSNCNRPLNPNRVIKSHILCSCGEILDYDSDFCPECGRNIQRSIRRKNSLKNLVNKLR